MNRDARGQTRSRGQNGDESQQDSDIRVQRMSRRLKAVAGSHTHRCRSGYHGPTTTPCVNHTASESHRPARSLASAVERPTDGRR
jgi:hypothetical protein